jgi:hypothetical protein
MIKIQKIKLAAAVAGVLIAGQASAHVGYGNALYTGAGQYDPLTGTTSGAAAVGAAANFTATVSSNAGYLTGLDSQTLGNTHDIRFRYFILDKASTVSFTINGLANATISGNANPALNGLTPDTLNPAFSLYTGVVPAASHDGVGDIASIAANPATHSYLATEKGFAAWSPFAALDPVIATANGNTSTNQQWGVFDSNGNITTGNNGAWTATSTAATDTHGPNYLGTLDTPKAATITYTGISGADAAIGSVFTDSQGNSQAVIGADGTVDHSVSWSGNLAAGIYTLAIGGANLSDYAHYYTDTVTNGGAIALAGTAEANAYAADRLARSFNITGFQVSAVPVPGAVWLFLSGMMGVLGLNRRKNSALSAAM